MKDRQLSILNTWGKEVVNLCFYTDFNTNIGNQICLTNNDTYSSGAEKQVLEIHRIRKDTNLLDNFKWFFFCDDDTFVNYKNLVTYCENLDDTKCYGHIGNSFMPDLTLNYFSGGAGFLIPSKILKNNKDIIFYKDIIWGDVHVGLWLRQNGITLINEGRLNNNTPEEVGKTSKNIIKNQISFHYIKTFEKMKELFDTTL